MCTGISHSAAIAGAGKGPRHWFPLTKANVAFDHASHTAAEHALLLDFTNYDIGADARVAVEMDLASGKALLAELRRVIEGAEAAGLGEQL